MFRLTLLVLLFPLVTFADGVATVSAEDCGDGYVQMLLPFSGEPIRDVSTGDRYYVYSAEDPRFYAAADIDITGALTMGICTKLYKPDGTELRSNLRGSEEYGKIMEHFKGRFKRIRSTFTRTDDGDGSPMDDQLREINRLTASGMSLRTAVRNIFSGKQAEKYGFTEIYVDTQEGSPGSYTTVVVEFSKPGTKRVIPFWDGNPDDLN